LTEFHKKLKKDLKDLNADDQATGVKKLKEEFKNQDIPLPPLPGPKRNDLIDLSWALQDSHGPAGAQGLGACGFIVNGVPQCCNLTQAQCALIPGSTFDANKRCPPEPAPKPG
jgi:hypothetical protein